MASNTPTYRAEGTAQFAQQPQYQYGEPHHAAPPFAIDTDMANMDSFADSVSGAPHPGATLSSSGVSVSDAAAAPPPPHAMSTSPAHARTLPPGLSLGAPSTPGMAPPQATGSGHRNSIGPGSAHPLHTPYSPTGPRPSIDENADLGLSGGDPKRKRSKVSRACDECRRKKVRCDAAGDDGSIKTCTNCAKAGVLCGYNRIPMKRGPSKGYIKELSERVQQVESQMAMSTNPGNFRQSLDASASGGIYPDQSLYSPEDSMAFKRNFSFSDQQQQRSPFANPEYHRDRMPSVGWNAGSPHASGFRGSFSAGERLGHRGSVAVAPDQQAPLPSATPLARPFWMGADHDGTDGPRAAKRQKLDTDAAGEITGPALSPELLAKYYAEFHANLPVLPDGDVSIEIVQQATAKVQHAFVAAVTFLPGATLKLHNGTDVHDAPTSAVAPPLFTAREDLAEFMWDVARQRAESRSQEDNLVLLWTYLLMAVEAENDLARLRDGSLSKALIIKQAVDLGWSWITVDHRTRSVTAAEGSSSYRFRTYWARAWYCAGILARLHALAVGSGNPMPLQQDTPLPNPPAVFSSSQSFPALASVALGTVISLVQNMVPPLQYGRQIDTMMRQHTLAHLDNVFAMVQLDRHGETQAQHIRLFYDLLLSRFTLLSAPFEILQPAIDLAEALKHHTTASEDKNVYDPMKMHTFTLTTITLLEFTQDGTDEESSKAAQAALQTIQGALEHISEIDHVHDQQQQQQPPLPPAPLSLGTMNEEELHTQQQEQQQQPPAAEGNLQGQNGPKEAAGPNTTPPHPGTTGTTGTAETVPSITHDGNENNVTPSPVSTTVTTQPIHWADALLGMIETRQKTADAAAAAAGGPNGSDKIHIDQSGTTAAADDENGNGNGNGNEGPSHEPIRNVYGVSVDFSRLLKYGYLNVLAESAGV